MKNLLLSAVLLTLPLLLGGCVPKETDGRPQSWPGLQLGFPPPIWYKPSNYHGGKKYEANYKDGKLDGLVVSWHENGQKHTEANYKDGKLDGLWVVWHENGQKAVEANYKDGKEEGLETQWHENGQNGIEKNYKDGTLVEGSAKYWNSKGEPVDSLEEARK